MKTTLLAAAAALILSACASYDGRGLVPGRSTGAEVEKLMGRPAERLQMPNGETVLYFTRAPNGRDTYAARLKPDGTLIAVEQRLDQQYFDQVVAGRTVKREVLELLGPPWKVAQVSHQNVEQWDYLVLYNNRWFDFFVEFDPSGRVVRTWLLHDAVYDAAGTFP